MFMSWKSEYQSAETLWLEDGKQMTKPKMSIRDQTDADLSCDCHNIWWA